MMNDPGQLERRPMLKEPLYEPNNDHQQQYQQFHPQKWGPSTHSLHESMPYAYFQSIHQAQSFISQADQYMLQQYPRDMNAHEMYSTHFAHPQLRMFGNQTPIECYRQQSSEFEHQSNALVKAEVENHSKTELSTISLNHGLHDSASGSPFFSYATFPLASTATMSQNFPYSNMALDAPIEVTSSSTFVGQNLRRHYIAQSKRRVENPIYSYQRQQKSNIKNDNNSGELTSSTVWCGNVCPNVTKAEFKTLFEQFGEVVLIRHFSHSKCAFVTFKSNGCAKAALSLEGRLLGTMRLTLNLGKLSRHLWLGNVVESVTEADLTELFCKWGPLESVRLLRKNLCAFINFVNERDAWNAANELNNFMLKGNRLVVNFQWPKTPRSSLQQQHYHNSLQQLPSRNFPDLNKMPFVSTNVQTSHIIPPSANFAILSDTDHQSSPQNVTNSMTDFTASMHADTSTSASSHASTSVLVASCLSSQGTLSEASFDAATDGVVTDLLPQQHNRMDEKEHSAGRVQSSDISAEPVVTETDNVETKPHDISKDSEYPAYMLPMHCPEKVQRKPARDFAPSRQLFIGNLLPSVTYEDLFALFSPFGAIISIRLFSERGYAFVLFKDLAVAHAVKERMTASKPVLGGRGIAVNYGKPVEDPVLDTGSMAIYPASPILTHGQHFGNPLPPLPMSFAHSGLHSGQISPIPIFAHPTSSHIMSDHIELGTFSPTLSPLIKAKTPKRVPISHSGFLLQQDSRSDFVDNTPFINHNVSMQTFS